MIILIAFWLIGFILIFAKQNKIYPKYFGIGTLMAGSEGLVAVLTNYSFLNINSQFVPLITGLLNSLSYYGTNYFYFLFTLSYSNFFKNKKIEQALTITSALPYITLFFIFPISYGFHTDMSVVTIFATLYVMSGNLLLVYTYFKEKKPWIKKEYFLTRLFAVFASSMLLFMHYIVPTYINKYLISELHLNIAVFAAAIIFLFFVIRFGILEVHLILEQKQFGTTLETIICDTRMLNHAIKNHISVVDISTTLLSDEKFLSEKGKNHIVIIQETINHMKNFLMRMQKITNPISLREEKNDLSLMLKFVLLTLKSLFEEKNISIVENYNDNFQLICDKTHLQETFINILLNAYEAMHNFGVIEINIYQKNKSLIVEISDNGKGISQNDLPHVIEPFFSTKNGTKNFGLGLTYCYRVMQKHGGMLKIESQIHLGTTVILKFPYYKVINKLKKDFSYTIIHR